MPAKKMRSKRKLPIKVIKYLEKSGLKHQVIEHKTVYTALDVAQTMKRQLAQVAKTLLVKADKDYYLVLLSADQNLDLIKLKKVVASQTKKEIKVLKIPNEKSIKEVLKFKKEEALTAFAGLYQKPLIMEKSLAKAKKVIFSSESFNHSVEMAVKDFIRLENAFLASFGVKKKLKLVATEKSKKKKPAPKKFRKK